MKHWAKMRGVNETYRGTLSSYAYESPRFYHVCRPWNQHISLMLMALNVHISMKFINFTISVLKARRASQNCYGRSSTTGHSITITGTKSSPFAWERQ
uniref:Uncharacterized protein n=1 Tax=Arundo donax TaxID=35708 RepID=A0A0A9GK71_ARUDO